MNKKKHILLTNDDGIHALGLRHLWNALQRDYTITIVAPQSEQSSVGMSITTRSPLQIQRITWPNDTNAWAVSGTPADCVKLAWHKLMDNPPDLIVSGINRGSNAGRNVLYSGTVAGVIEGILHDIPGIAFSTGDYEKPIYEPTESYVKDIVGHVLQHPLPSGSLLNVNFPKDASAGYKGVKMTRQGRQYWGENPDERTHPGEGHAYYWLGSQLFEFDEHEDSDIFWLAQGYVTAVPIHVHELTDHTHLNNHKKTFEDHFTKV